MSEFKQLWKKHYKNQEINIFQKAQVAKLHPQLNALIHHQADCLAETTHLITINGIFICQNDMQWIASYAPHWKQHYSLHLAWIWLNCWLKYDIHPQAD